MPVAARTKNLNPEQPILSRYWDWLGGVAPLGLG